MARHLGNLNLPVCWDPKWGGNTQKTQRPMDSQKYHDLERAYQTCRFNKRKSSVLTPSLPRNWILGCWWVLSYKRKRENTVEPTWYNVTSQTLVGHTTPSAHFLFPMDRHKQHMFLFRLQTVLSRLVITVWNRFECVECVPKREKSMLPCWTD